MTSSALPPQSGRTVARSGRRMMPLFPPPPLSTVRRVFPSTAGRLAYQTAPSLTSRWLSLHPASSASRQLCVCPSCTPWLHLTFRSVSEQCARWCHARSCLLYPRGPRSGLGYIVPVHHHLIGLMRPTHGHIAISPHCGL